MEIKISKLVSLPVNPEKSEFAPVKLPYEGNKKLIEQVAVAVKMGKPVLLSGETGTGKTSLVRHLASLTNNGFRRLNLNGGTGTDELLGKTLLNKDGTYWVDGVLVDGMKKGYWVLLDEINASSAEVLFALHSLLDDDGYIVLAEHNGEIVRPHPSFRLFASMNPSSDYVGTKDMNKALVSRFFVVKTDFPHKDEEVKILQKRVGISRFVGQKMANFAGEMRAMYRSGKTAFILSTRELIQWAESFNVYKKYLPSAEVAILNKVAEEDFTSIKDLLSLHFKKLDKPSSKEGETEIKDEKLKIGDEVEITDGSFYSFSGTGSQGTIKNIDYDKEEAKVEFNELKNSKQPYTGKFPVIWTIDLKNLKKI